MQVFCYELVMQDGCTPLIYGCKSSLGGVVKLLINKGSSLDVTDKVSTCKRTMFHAKEFSA